VAGKGIDDVVRHFTQAISALPVQPIVIGHSFGGLIAQRLLSAGTAVAAMAIDQGGALRVASIALRNPANRNRAVALTAEQFRYGFGNAVSESEASGLYERWAIPSPGRPLFEAAVANFGPHSPAKVDTRKADRGPLLVTAGGKDHTVPAAISMATVRLYARSHAITDLRQFPDRGQSPTIDSGWRDVANACLTWLRPLPVARNSRARGWIAPGPDCARRSQIRWLIRLTRQRARLGSAAGAARPQQPGWRRG